jgi:DUF4097 and DUF4098 domain-containing protein YvlB
MLHALLAAATLLAPQQQTDTTVTVRSGMRLTVSDFGGSITVTTWAKNAVRVTAEHGSRDHVTVRAGISTVAIEASGRYGPATVNFEITVPEWMSVSLEGVNTEMTVRGTKAPVSVETVQGDIIVDGGAEQVTLNSVNGEVRLSGARGRVSVTATNQGIWISDVIGDVTAEGVNGDVVLEKVDAANVDANTVNGDVSYGGTIKDGGHYRFSTHNGDVTVAMDETHTNATVSVATFNGDFDPGFSVRLAEIRKGRRFSFTLGTGSAKVELESFEGTIALRRPGMTRSRH